MILYIDTFISETALSPNFALEKLLSDVQKSAKAYRKQSKIDIFKYSLASYSNLKWDKVIIRIDGENRDELSSLIPFIKKLYRSPDIRLERSDTGLKYSNNLSDICPDNKDQWIFFSPNNDHPFIGKDPEIFKKLIVQAEAAEIRYGLPVTIVYSHFTELINSIKNNSYLYGYNGDFGEILDESENSFTVKFNHIYLLSLQIFRAKFLRDAMKRAGNSRVIRTECLGKHVIYNNESIVIVPKSELCRHYDGYLHTYSVINDFIKASTCPPLFIPNGFFENKIKIKYGYDKYFDGYLNINPNAESYIFENSNGTDIAINKDDLPSFWLQRIDSFEINPSFKSKLNQYQPLIQKIKNPWNSYSKIYIKIIIIYRRLYYYLKFNYLKNYFLLFRSHIYKLIKSFIK